MTPSENAPASKSSPWLNAAGLGASLLVCYGVATLGSLFTVPNLAGWYAQLNKPSWNPPNALFTPVWLTLFGLMAIAGWLVWLRRHHVDLGAALKLFGLQLVLNAAWSWLFFTQRQPGLALVELAALWLAILATLIACWRVRAAAGLLLVPYLLWVSFAAALNFELWRLN